MQGECVLKRLQCRECSSSTPALSAYSLPSNGYESVFVTTVCRLVIVHYSSYTNAINGTRRDLRLMVSTSTMSQTKLQLKPKMIRLEKKVGSFIMAEDETDDSDEGDIE